MTSRAGMIPKRKQMSRLASPFHICFFLLMSLGSGSLFCAVLLASHFHVWGFSDDELAVMNKLPESVVLLAVGMGGFCLFFPWFLALYLSRYFLSELERLDAQIASLSEKQGLPYDHPDV
jgi:hypothetical protein